MIAALAALFLAQETVPTAPSEAPPLLPPAASTAEPPEDSAPVGDLSAVPPLPTGLLAPVGRDDAGETYLVVDRAQKAGDIADFWTFEVFIPPIQIRPGEAAAQGLSHHQVDCQARTDQTIASAGYDEAGTAIVALAAAPAEPLTAGSAYALIADRVCNGDKSPMTGQLTGHAAAVRAATSTLQTPKQ
ncbi:MAG TPA: surface-adhesin E family protein [Caulobacteraceae bacterium]